jgi:Mrp family chromosome partitioning ATPase
MAKDSRKKVGILDLDIFGPSIPTLMGLNRGEEPELTNSKLSGTACFTELRNTRRRIGPIDESWNPLHVHGLSFCPEGGLGRR